MKKIILMLSLVSISSFAYEAKDCTEKAVKTAEKKYNQRREEFGGETVSLEEEGQDYLIITKTGIDNLYKRVVIINPTANDFNQQLSYPAYAVTTLSTTLGCVVTGANYTTSGLLEEQEELN